MKKSGGEGRGTAGMSLKLLKEKKKDMFSTHPLGISSNTVRKKERDGNKHETKDHIDSLMQA